MFTRQISGSCVCISCNQLISVTNQACPHCQHSHPNLWGYSRTVRRLGQDFGFINVVTWGCALLYVATLLIDLKNVTTSGSINLSSANLFSPSVPSLLLFGATGATPAIGMGRWWTILSAGWLHGSLWHILFNMLWLRGLVPQVAKGFGAGRLVIIYTVSIVAGGFLSSFVGYVRDPFLQDAHFAIGASGGLFGLMGALVAYGQITKDFTTRREFWILALVLFTLGLVTPHTDNWGHLGGFLGGYLISRMNGINPREREGVTQFFLAIGCLGLTLMSLLTSLIHGAYACNFFKIWDS
jgi:rhomboid protease GluP